MGTNFYLMTSDRQKRDKWFDEYECELTDTPEWGYEVHIAKTSCGWKPLFESHKRIRSVRDIKAAINDGFRVVDEYGQFYNLDEFVDRVVNFNADNDQAISHPEYEGGMYRDSYFLDTEGYEFTEHKFS